MRKQKINSTKEIANAIIHRKIDITRPGYTVPLPYDFRNDNDWIEVKTIAEFKEFFDQNQWLFVKDFPDYEIFIKKDHVVFATSDKYLKMSKMLIESLTAEEREVLLENLDTTIRKLKKINVYSLVKMFDKELEITATLDIAKIKVSLSRTKDFSLKKMDSEKEKFASNNLKLENDAKKSYDALKGLDTYQLSEWCAAKNVDIKGLGNKKAILKVIKDFLNKGE